MPKKAPATKKPLDSEPQDHIGPPWGPVPFSPPPSEFMEPLLVQFVCDGCKGEKTKEIIALANDLASDIDNLPARMHLDERFIRHTAPVFTKNSKTGEDEKEPSGYAFCGNYQAVRVWRQVPITGGIQYGDKGI